MAAVLILYSSSSAFTKTQFEKLSGTDWFGIYMGRSKIGYARNSVEQDSSGRWVVNSATTITFKVNQASAAVSETDNRIYDAKTGELVLAQYISKSPAGDIKIEGRLEAGSFTVTALIAGRSTTKNFPRPVENIQEVFQPQFMAIAGAAVFDDTIKLRVYMAQPPISSPIERVIIFKSKKQELLGGIPIEVFTFTDSLPGFGLGGEIAIADNGHIIEQRVAGMALFLKAEPQQIALQVDESFDMLANNVVICDSGPTDPKAITRASYLISGYEIAALPKSERLKIHNLSSDSALVMISGEIAVGDSITIPVRDTSTIEFLSSEPLIQSDAPEIILQAQEIVKGESRAYPAAKAINKWVYENVHKEYSPELSNALSTLHTKKGDCGEHAALAVALMRAVGIPARVAGGLVYWPEGKGFAYHAWVEAYVGRWIQLDPAWGEDIANATHIMLANGGFEAQIGSLARSMRRLRIRFLSFE